MNYVTAQERESCKAAMVAHPGPTADALLDEIERLRALLVVETPREKELEMCLREVLSALQAPKVDFMEARSIQARCERALK